MKKKLLPNSDENILQLKEQLKNQEDKIFQLTNLLANSPGDLYWKNKEGVWIGLNKRCAESLHRMGFIKEANEQKVIGKNDYQLFDKATADGYRIHDNEVMEIREN